MGNFNGNKTKEYDQDGGSLWLESISPEIMFNIFIHVPVRDLLTSANRVSRNWHHLLTDRHFWFFKLKEEGLHLSCESRTKLLQEGDNAKVLRILQGICGGYLPFNTNLIRNPSGQGGLSHWSVRHGGSRLVVECPPVGSDPIPKEAGLPSQHCFVTSYNTCTRTQHVRLREIGVHGWMVDLLRPKIHISEWVSARWDCDSMSQVLVSLAGSSLVQNELLTWSSKEDDVVGRKWYKVEKILDSYPEDLQKITFQNSGKDSQFWAGNYGAKTAGSSVRLVV